MICYKCKCNKRKSSFHKDRKSTRGVYHICKECRKVYSKNYFWSNREKMLVKTRKYLENPEMARRNRERVKKWHQEHKDDPIYKSKRKKRDKKRYWANIPKVRARTAVRDALSSGRLIKRNCEKCGESKSQAHHDDYSKKLEVRWLCYKHHLEVTLHQGVIGRPRVILKKNF